MEEEKEKKRGQSLRAAREGVTTGISLCRGFAMAVLTVPLK